MHIGRRPRIFRYGLHLTVEEFKLYIGSDSTLVVDHNFFYFPHNQAVLSYGEASYICVNTALIGEDNFCGDLLFSNWSGASRRITIYREMNLSIGVGTVGKRSAMDLKNRPWMPIQILEFMSTKDSRRESSFCFSFLRCRQHSMSTTPSGGMSKKMSWLRGLFRDTLHRGNMVQIQ